MPRRATTDQIHAFVKELLRRWTQQQNRSARELANILGLSEGFLSQVKSDRARMGLEPLIDLAGAFGWSLPEMLDRAEAFARGGLEEEARVEYERTTPVFGNLPSWPAALEAAKRAFRSIPDDVWAGVAASSAADFPHNGLLDAEILLKLAETYRAMKAAPRKTEEDVRREIEEDEPLDPGGK